MEYVTLEVTQENHGMRLDAFVSQALRGLFTRAYIQKLISDGCLTKNGIPSCDKSKKVAFQDEYILLIPDRKEISPSPENIPLNVVFEDDHIIVINKPAGLITHPGAGNPNGTLVNALLHHCNGTLSTIAGTERQGIVHRLDKDTSGLIIAAKTDAAHESLSKQFTNREILKIYIAITNGIPLRPCGRIETLIGRHPVHREKRSIVKEGGKIAITNYKVLHKKDGIATLECTIETGRTHQIRVHLAHIKAPVLWDSMYGHGCAEKRQALHAKSIKFAHPVTGLEMFFDTCIPDDLCVENNYTNM